MTTESAPLLRTNDLTIDPEAGEIRNPRGEMARLGPVNMRILRVLVDRAGQVVPRNDLFEEVWANQTVTDDALTRCVSDIRLELSKLSKGCKYIETIPKRGYRWNPVALVSDADIRSTSSSPVESNIHGTRERHPDIGSTRATAWISRGIVYAVLLLTTASLGVWIVDKASRPELPIVVVMPIQTESDNEEVAARIEQQITQYLLSLNRVDLLSSTAIQSRPANPFPYFFHEFGARWLMESEISGTGEDYYLSVALVDARAGIVLFQQTNSLSKSERVSAADIELIIEPFLDLFDSNIGF